MPAALSSLPEPGRLPISTIPAGAVLLAAAAFCFVAWNWSGVSAAVRLALPGVAVQRTARRIMDGTVYVRD